MYVGELVLTFFRTWILHGTVRTVWTCGATRRRCDIKSGTVRHRAEPRNAVPDPM